MADSICPQCENPKPLQRKFCSKTCSNRSRNLTSNSIEKAREHFLTKVRVPNNPNACWEWLGSLNRTGYGNFRFRRTMWLAHRVAWTLFVGKIPEGFDVLHEPIICHNRTCTNYRFHLRLGTDQDNMDDRRIDGTHIEGSKRWNAKLTEELVQHMRYEYHVLGMYPHDLAKKYGVGSSIIVKICKYDGWTHVPDITADGNPTDYQHLAAINKSLAGSHNPIAKLTEENVREIRRLRKETGLRYNKIAEIFGVSDVLISHICNRRAWKHVPDL